MEIIGRIIDDYTPVMTPNYNYTTIHCITITLYNPEFIDKHNR